MASFPRKLTFSGGPKANRHKVKAPTKIRTSGKPQCKVIGPSGKNFCTRAKGHQGNHYYGTHISYR